MQKNMGEKFQSACNTWKSTEEDDEARARRQADAFNEAPGSLNKEDGYDCPFCKNKGMIQRAVYHEDVKYWATATHNCSCLAKRKAVRDKKESGLNASGRYTFASYNDEEQWQKRIKNAALAFVDDLDSGHWFFIGGQSGSGKTHITTALTNACIERGRRAKYMKWGEEITRIKGLIASDPAQYQIALNVLKSVPVLLIDDLFKGGRNDAGGFKPPTEADIKGAFDIINARYNDPHSITIISSERGINDIVNLDAAIGGRIAERAKDYIFNIPNNSRLNYRMKDMEC